MSGLNWCVGVDWASRNHQVCVLDGDVDRRTVGDAPPGNPRCSGGWRLRCC